MTRRRREVDDRHVMARIDGVADEMAADEPMAAEDDQAHSGAPCSFPLLGSGISSKPIGTIMLSLVDGTPLPAHVRL